MEFIAVLVDNYKTSTSGLNVFVKILVAIALAFIFFAVISAFANVILNGV